MTYLFFGINKNNFRAVVATLLLLFFLSGAQAQENNIVFDKLTVEAGLSQSSVISITQDSMGFMWFGTKDGLNRYDAQQFEVFKNSAKNPKTLSSSQNINALFTDRKGNLWVGTQEGLNKYIIETKSFIRYLNDPKDKSSLSNNTIRCIYEDPDGNLWVGTENGLNKLIGDNKFERYFCKNGIGEGLVNPIIKAIHLDNKDNLWVGTQNGLVSFRKINGVNQFKTYYSNPQNINTISSDDITTITEDLNHNLWVGTHFTGLNLYNQQENSFRQITSSNSKLISNIIRKILVSRDGLLWIATINGISIYDPVLQKFSNQYHNPESQGTLNQNSIYDIYQDAVGSIWVGTYYGGINVYHPNAIPINVYRHFSYKNSLSSNIISSLLQDNKGNLWIGTEAEGLNYFNRTTNTFSNFKFDENKNSISSNLIKAIDADANYNLWIAAYEGGIDFYNTNSNVFKNYSVGNGNSLSEKRITYLLIDQQERIWVSTKGKGLFLFNKEKDDFEALNSKGKPFYFPSNNIVHLFLDKKQTLWVATDDGLYYLSKGSRKFMQINAQENSFLKHISTIAQSSKGEILLGTYNEGLGFFNLEKGKIAILTKNSGLPSNNIAAILQDNEQKIWVSTDKGIASILSKEIKVYNRNDGLPGNVFNYHSALKDSNGNLFFGGYNGLVSFNPQQIVENKIAPKVVFTHLKLFNKEIPVSDTSEILSKSLNKIDKLVLSYQQNVFSIDFSALNYVKAKKNKYAYKLQGFEDNWNYVDNPTASFTNLPDGNYTLLVKGSNNDGIWNNTASALAIKIKPPFWKTWWAYLFYLAFAIALLYLVMRFLLIRALLKREHDINQMKLEFFTNVSHEIRTPLTLIIGPLEKLINETQQNFSINKQLLTVNKNARRLMKLVNELMDFRKVGTGNLQLNISSDNIVDFVKEIFLSFQQLAIQQKVEYDFQSDEDFIEAYFDKDQLEKVVFNLLSNAFKFVPDENGKIAVNIQHKDNQIYIRIIDNGVGIPEQSKKNLFSSFYQADNQLKRNSGSSGIGLALSKSIARLHHGDLTLEDHTSDTIFCLSLNTGIEQYKNDDFKLVSTADKYEFKRDITEIDEFPKKKTSIVSNQPLLLVVDDNLEVRDFIEKSLNQIYQVVTAADGKQALNLAFDKIPDVIISDVMMPEMDGFQLCNQLKTDIRTRHIPVILLTARSGDLHELDGLKNGADIYLTKPFSIQKLRLIVENQLALHENMRAKFSRQFSLEPSNVEIESSDEEFLTKVMKLLEDNISNSDFNVNLFASEIGMSTPVFYKKIYALTGLTVNNFMKSIRLKRAMQLLNQNAGNVSEIAYMVGFNDAKYFSKEFRKQFGKAPSAFQ